MLNVEIHGNSHKPVNQIIYLLAFLIDWLVVNTEIQAIHEVVTLSQNTTYFPGICSYQLDMPKEHGGD